MGEERPIETMEDIAAFLGVCVRKAYYLAPDMRKKKVLFSKKRRLKSGRYVKVNFTYASKLEEWLGERGGI